MEVAAMANGIPKLCFSQSSPQIFLKPTEKKLMSSPKFTQNPSSNSTLKPSSPSPIYATNSPVEEDNPTTKPSNGVPQEDLEYLLTLGAGSFAAAIVIKYGSVLFPEIARPNILVALVIVLTPVILAVVILIKQSVSK